jgi:predicted dehydrogenase
MNVIYNHGYAEKLKTCFIGCGGHATRNVFPTFQYAPVHLAAVCDLNRDAAETARRQFGAERAYTDHQEMLERERPDVVFIVTNYDEEGKPRYPKLAAECLRAGAHAWIEKPPASSSGEILEMMRVSQETGKFIGVGFKKMFFPANVKAWEISQRPEFGPITSINARYPQFLPSMEERGVRRKMISFLDHMVHPHSLLKLLGGELEWIFVNRSAGNGAAQVSLRFKNGIIGNLHLAAGCSGLSPFERTEIVGEGANVIVDNNIRVTYYRRANMPAYGRAGTYFGSDEEAPLHWEPEFSLGQLHNKAMFLLGYAPEVIHFTTCLLEGKPPERGTLEDALELMKVYEAYLKGDGQIVSV